MRRGRGEKRLKASQMEKKIDKQQRREEKKEKELRGNARH